MYSNALFNQRIKQILLLIIIIGLMVLAIKELTIFLPGLLGAVTLYIVSRKPLFKMVYHKKWKKGWVCLGFIIFYLIMIGIPLTIAITLISPKINSLLQDPQELIQSAKLTLNTIQQKIGIQLVSQEGLTSWLNKVTAFIPTLVNSTLNLVSNLAILLFVLYYMLYHASDMERYFARIIPLKKSNIQILSYETKKLVISNALGIPLISLIQGIVATVGYVIFGVQDWALYGFLTGVFAFFPVVGTMIVWVPLVLYMFAVGDTLNATLVGIYSLVVTGNIDYVARITLLKKMGNVHPVMTILGVLIGLGLFGFVGLVFGPLLLNYIIVLYKIYMNEFVYTEEELDKGVAADPPPPEELPVNPV